MCCSARLWRTRGTASMCSRCCRVTSTTMTTPQPWSPCARWCARSSAILIISGTHFSGRWRRRASIRRSDDTPSGGARLHTPEVFIDGVGVFLPDRVAVKDAVEQGWYPAEEATAHQFVGVAVAGDLPAPQMALRAGRSALERSGRAAADIDVLLYPDGWHPQYYLQHHLLGGNVLAAEVRQGCNGMFTALELAAGYLRADAGRRSALLVSADNFGTPLIDRWRIGPGFIAGDASAAVVLTVDEAFARLCSVCSVTVADAEEMHRSGDPLFPPAATVGRSLDFCLRAEDFKRRALASPTMMASLIEVQKQVIETAYRALAEAGIGIKDVSRVLFTNVSREVVEHRVMAALGLSLSQSTWDFGRTVGHLGASDQVVSLEHLLVTGQLAAGDHVLMLGTGPGVTISGAVIQILALPAWSASSRPPDDSIRAPRGWG